jgi:hypothetical protein
MLFDDDGAHAFVAGDARGRREQFLDDERRQALERLVEQQQAGDGARAPGRPLRACQALRP